MTTLLRLLRDQQRLTQPAMLDRLERRARELGEGDFALSGRQFARLEAGEIKTAPRQANRRVIEAEYATGYEDLMAVVEDDEDAGETSKVVAAATAGTPAQHFQEIIASLSWIDHRQGPLGVRDPAVAVYRSVLSTARTSTRGDRRDWLRLAARCAELIGWFYQDSGMPGKAREWTAQALDLAEGVQAGELIPYFLMRRSSIAIDLGAGGDALLLAERSLRRARSGPERALALREVAAAHALNGNARGFEQAVETALDHACGRDPRTPLAPYCTLPYLRSEAGAAALVLGDVGLAISYLDLAVREWSGGQERDRAICMARLALAWADQRDVEQAASIALAAASVAASAPSPRAAGVLGEVLRVVGQVAGHHRAVRLGEQLASIR